jgi:hypothetical protein
MQLAGCPGIRSLDRVDLTSTFKEEPRTRSWPSYLNAEIGVTATGEGEVDGRCTTPYSRRTDGVTGFGGVDVEARGASIAALVDGGALGALETLGPSTVEASCLVVTLAARATCNAHARSTA